MTQRADCVFCKIAAGTIPSLKVLEDEHCLAFLDINPLAEGHLLLIPKRHFEQLDQVPPDVVAALAKHLPRLTAAVTTAAQAEGCNVLQNNGRAAGQVVAHVHVHIIPRRAGDALGYRWPASSYAPGRAEKMHARLQASLQAPG